MSSSATERSLPDVAGEAEPGQARHLDWVGMRGVELPVRIADPDGSLRTVPAQVALAVDLQATGARGIHMSRLYLQAEQALSSEPFGSCMLRRLLKAMLESHGDSADRALLRIDYTHLASRAALSSGLRGWRSYPVRVEARMENGQFGLELGVTATYSSTCPSSAALARQLIQQRFELDFAGDRTPSRAAVIDWLGSPQGICATPHSQRSRAEVRVRLQPSLKGLPVEEAIERIESALATPVQAAVKREDEQAFALLNGQNLMFCEDAARRIRGALEAWPEAIDYWLRVAHLESLHPHDAVAVACKGLPGGYRADHGL